MYNVETLTASEAREMANTIAFRQDEDARMEFIVNLIARCHASVVDAPRFHKNNPPVFTINCTKVLTSVFFWCNIETHQDTYEMFNHENSRRKINI